MPPLSRDQRADYVAPILAGVRDRLLAKITERCPDAADSLPVPALDVPTADGYEAAVKELFANLFDERGSKAAAWISARDGAADPKAVTEVYELIYDWYPLLCSAKEYLQGRSRDGFDMNVERLNRKHR